MKKLQITLTRSTIRATKNQLANVKALGLTKIGDQVTHEDNAAIRGMCNKISHLLKVEVVEVEAS